MRPWLNRVWYFDKGDLLLTALVLGAILMAIWTLVQILRL